MPLTYFRFSSSFICSARSSVGGTWGVVVGAVGFGVPLEELGPEARFFRGDPSARRVDPSAVWVTTGESVMATWEDEAGGDLEDGLTRRA